MASKTKKSETAEETVVESTFTKKQFVKSNKFGRYQDYLNANLEDGKTYTKAEVAKMIEKTYKVKIDIN